MNIQMLHEKALSLSKTYKESESGLLDVLTELLKSNGFLQLGYPHLFGYCVSALRLSEAQAAYFSKVAKKSEEVPELKAAVEQGIISLSQARRVVPVITKDNSSDWINKAALLTQRELEREVCAVNPKAMPREKIRIVSGDRAVLTVGMSNELERDVTRAHEIVGLDKGLEELLGEMTRFFLKHKDPVEKAKRVTQKKTRVTKAAKPPSSGKLPVEVRHEVNQRDEGRCRALLPDGILCGSTAWVQHHHVKPKSHGGPDLPDNLVTLCASHHRLAHQTGLNNLRL